jgi:hypothetical protein
MSLEAIFNDAAEGDTLGRCVITELSGTEEEVNLPI